jgi:hypothetical protein
MLLLTEESDIKAPPAVPELKEASTIFEPLLSLFSCISLTPSSTKP